MPYSAAGQNATLNDKTDVGGTLTAHDYEARAFIADYLDAAFTKRNKVTKNFEPAHHHKQHDHKLAPRTIKRAVLGQDDWLLGLCSMRRMDDAAAL